MNVYEARWKNAVKVACKINKFLADGYLVFDENDEVVKEPFRITAKEVVLPIGGRSAILYFLRDRSFDNGAHTKISEYNEMFSKWKAVRPEHIQSI